MLKLGIWCERNAKTFGYYKVERNYKVERKIGIEEILAQIMSNVLQLFAIRFCFETISDTWENTYNYG